MSRGSDCREDIQDVDDGAAERHFTFFTFGTRAVPGFSQGGAALGLQSGSVDVDLTAIIDYLQPAGALGRLCATEKFIRRRLVTLLELQIYFKIYI